MSRHGNSRLQTIILHAALIAAGMIVVVPVIWVLAAAFRTQISLLTSAFWFSPVLKNFNDVLFSKTSDFLVNYRNSLVVGIASTLICLVTATLAAWSLHRMTERQVEKWLTPEGEADLMKAQCLKRKLYPDDVAKVVVFLASEEAGACTSQQFIVDGGRV